MTNFKIILNDFDVPIDVEKLPDGVTFEQVPYSGAYRVRVLLYGQTVTCLHRIDPAVEKGTAQLPDMKTGKLKPVRYTKLIGGKWQLQIDRETGCGRLFDSHRHAANAALLIHSSIVKRILKKHEGEQRAKAAMQKKKEEAGASATQT